MLQYRPCFKDDLRHYRVYHAMQKILGFFPPLYPTITPFISFFLTVPHWNRQGHDPITTINALMEVVYMDLFQLALRYKLPIIDLSNTFDIHDAELYVSQIEPSAKGGQLITSLIKHVFFNHLYEESALYSVENGSFKVTKNIPGFQWKVDTNSNTEEVVNLLKPLLGF
eukprot:TRINITY_DN190_c0_g1_i20.p1 TRINITY_DN190_c0_g1~~TRINITY_DN190_c0_g1_i20.p1  ORF type:complete len:169 (+),score=27.15 TRINITY_DN190_c0_g1_i20:561-1067(+)